MKVGISINAPTANQDALFINGMMQNIKFFFDLLELIGFDPFFVAMSNEPLSEEQLNVTIKEKSYKTLSLAQLYDSGEAFDAFIEVGFTIGAPDREKIRRDHGAKFIILRYGNSLVMDIQETLYGTLGGFRNIAAYADELWYSPHFERSKTYLSSIHNCPAHSCPYLWEPEFVDQGFTDEVAEGEVPDLVIMEPNIDVVKTCLIPVCIVNEVFLNDSESFDKAWILNGQNVRENEFFLKNVVNNLAVMPDHANKVFFSERASFEGAFPKKRILVGHHWENELNYLYCEALYKGVPLVHNVDSWREVGYYYPECAVDLGAKQTTKAIQEFNETPKHAINSEFLHRYSINNKDVQNSYIQLFERAINA